MQLLALAWLIMYVLVQSTVDDCFQSLFLSQELVWMLVNDVDTEAGKESLTVRSVWLEGQDIVVDC